MFWKSMRYVSGHRGKFRDLTSAFLAKQLHFYCLLSIYQHHAIFAVLPNTSTQSALLLPPREVHIGAMLGLTVMSQAITLSGF